ncbi:MAG: sugar phosphate nucleotidyltransferase, partial [Rickettsiales bacterium]
MKLQPIILAGGEGRRLAPLSTNDCPKPFIPLPDGQSLLEKTLRRLT